MSVPVVDRFPLLNKTERELSERSRLVPPASDRNPGLGPNGADAREAPHNYEQPLGAARGLIVKMDELERELNKKDPLGDIAELVRKLTYGEMVELAAAIWAAKPSEKSEDQLNPDNLPATLHRWATEAAKV